MVVELRPEVGRGLALVEPKRGVADVADTEPTRRAGIFAAEEGNQRLAAERLDKPLAARSLLRTR